jgi:hypothetical protein
LNLQQLVWLNVVRIDGQKEVHTIGNGGRLFNRGNGRLLGVSVQQIVQNIAGGALASFQVNPAQVCPLVAIPAL